MEAASFFTDAGGDAIHSSTSLLNALSKWCRGDSPPFDFITWSHFRRSAAFRKQELAAKF